MSAPQRNGQTKLCQYGEDCYRMNPQHFREFSHPHLEGILAEGIDLISKEYRIPSELYFSRDIVVSQLKILENLFPQKKCHNPAKINVPSTKGSESVTVTTSTTQFEIMPNEIKTDGDNVCSISKPSITAQNTSNILPTSSEGSSSGQWETPSTSNTTSRDTSRDTSRLHKKPKIDRNIHEYIKVVVPKGGMAKKLSNAAPFNFFLTAITDSKPTHDEPLSITFQEILDESLGELESSVQINFMVDIGWLLGHYYFAGVLDTPLLILYGDDTPELRTISEKKPQVTAIRIQMGSAFATHHTKMMLLGYKDGSMRVVISTANLYEDDWHNRTQGLWISPTLKALNENADTNAGESPTHFKRALINYLSEYKQSRLQPWIARIRKTDFSNVNVFLIASVPGGFRATELGHPWGHAALGNILSKHAAPIQDDSPVVAQSSSIGSLGPNIQSWIIADIVNSLRKDSSPLGLKRIPQFKMIYPSYVNAKNSHDGILGGGCLPYVKKTDDKQPWLKGYLNQWKAKSRHRNQAMPHIKTYCRWSDKGLHWFVLTSANLSKAAWGAFNKNAKIEPTLRIFNFEVGVVFLPKFVTGEDVFPLTVEKNGVPPFPIPYDIPLTRYGSDDKPFLMDYLMSLGY